jgi:biotin carboxyl carrier protein
MRLSLRLDSRVLAVEVHAEGRRHRVLVDGRTYDVQVSPIDGDSVLLEVEGRREIVHLARAGGERFVAVGGETYHFRPESAASSHAAMAALAEPEIRAPMPGKVLEVLVAPGDHVADGDGLLILEAMKMENRLAAPADGVVEALHVAPGDMVAGGQLLVLLRFDT